MPKLNHIGLGLALALLLPPVAEAEGLDTAKLDQLRSVVAEAALVERAAAGGRLTPFYADGLRRSFVEDLQELAKEPTFSPPAREALQAIGRRDLNALEALRDRLVRLERSHGRAG